MVLFITNIHESHINIIEYLVANGANFTSCSGLNALHWACFHGNYKLAKFLLIKNYGLSQ